jgi:hypothetical protein
VAINSDQAELNNRVALASAEVDRELDLLFVSAEVEIVGSKVVVSLRPSEAHKLVRVLRGSSTVA